MTSSDVGIIPDGGKVGSRFVLYVMARLERAITLSIVLRRMARPIRGEKYSSQVWVAFEPDSEHVEDLTLHPIRSSPYRRNARASFTVGQ